jgi:hypothetical protein
MDEVVHPISPSLRDEEKNYKLHFLSTILTQPSGNLIAKILRVLLTNNRNTNILIKCACNNFQEFLYSSYAELSVILPHRGSKFLRRFEAILSICWRCRLD